MKLSAAAIVAGCGTTALALLPLAVPPYYTGLMIPFQSPTRLLMRGLSGNPA